MHHRLDSTEQISLTAAFTDGGQLTEQWSDAYNVGLEAIDLEATGIFQKRFDVGKRLTVYWLPNETWQWTAGHIGQEDANRISLSYLLDTNTLRKPFLERIWGGLFADRRDRDLRDMVNDIYGLNIEYSTRRISGATTE